MRRTWWRRPAATVGGALSVASPPYIGHATGEGSGVVSRARGVEPQCVLGVALGVCKPPGPYTSRFVCLPEGRVGPGCWLRELVRMRPGPGAYAAPAPHGAFGELTVAHRVVGI